MVEQGCLAVTAKAVIYKLLSLNCFMLFALNGLYWFHKKHHFFHFFHHFFHWRKKIVTNVDAFFSTVKRKVSCALPKISRLLLFNITFKINVFRVCIAWYKHERGWENSRHLCKPETKSRVCITVENSPNPSSVYISGYANTGKKFPMLL